MSLWQPKRSWFLYEQRFKQYKHENLSGTSMKFTKPKLSFLLVLAGYTISLILFFYLFLKDANNLKTILLNQPFILIGLMLISILFIGISALTWSFFYNQNSKDIEAHKKIFTNFIIFQPFKYLPGGFSHFIVIESQKNKAFRSWRYLTKSIALFFILNSFIALMLGFVLLYFDISSKFFLVIFLSFLLIFFLLFFRFFRSFLKNVYIGIINHNSFTKLLFSSLLMTITWIFLGFQSFLAVNIWVKDFEIGLAITAIYLISTVLGFLTIFSPAGLGAREIYTLILFNYFLPENSDFSENLITYLIIMRLVSVVSELMLSFLFYRISKKVSDKNSNKILKYLIKHELIGSKATINYLDGGVSSDVRLIQDSGQRLIVKSSLPKLKTESNWYADTSRSVAEVAALRLLGSITPQNVPEVIDFFDNNLVIAAADESWIDLRKHLLETKDIDEIWLLQLMYNLASTLARWQNTTRDYAQLPKVFDSKERLRQLRTDPFHRSVASLRPDLKDSLLLLAHKLENNNSCLVHGDFSPKNVLVSTTAANNFWVIDAEVAHLGLAVFDQAYFSTHLILKAIYRPQHKDVLIKGLRHFNRNYIEMVDDSLLDSNWINHIGALLLARVVGKSPATYLTRENKVMVEKIATLLLQTETSDNPDNLISILLEHI